jgi:type IV pilus assembly protein PilB
MRISNETLKNLLTSSGKITPEAIRQAETIAAQTADTLEHVVVHRHMIGERELAALYAKSLKLPYADLTNVKIPREVLSRIPERIAKKYQVVLFGRDASKNTWQLAMADPEDIQAIDVIEKQLGSPLQINVATLNDILTVLDQYRTGLDTEINQAIRESAATGTTGKQSDTISAEDISEDAPIAKTVNIILEYAVKNGASDVHIEPRENIVQIRYRIDGILRESMTLPKQILPAVVSRIKILAALKIDEHRLPQDGRFKAVIGSKTAAVRVATLPIMDGEKVVMRILDESTKAASLEELGFAGQALKAIKNGMKQPDGMILVTGPTGSGKSTTLYSVLTMMNTPNVNISTVEDPVEYRIQGVNQTQVNIQAGMTFANGLRALLRQDPNIIMVGEIRDSETANLAVQAALTGHVVLSTLHTNNAATSLPRLLDMKIEPFLIASTVNTVVAQRLVRKLCTKCKTPFTPSGALLDEIRYNFNLDRALARMNGQAAPGPQPQPSVAPQPVVAPTPKLIADTAPVRQDTSRKVIPVPSGLDLERTSILDRIAKDPNIIDRPNGDGDDSSIGLATPKIEEQLPTPQPAKEAVADPSVLDEMPPAAHPNTNSDSLVLYRAVGCKQCGGSGFSGRMGIYEVLEITSAIGALITNKATADSIQKAGVSDGMVTMQEDGLTKALAGLTTIEEIMRVTRE